jgi:hypothetical protein
MKDMIEELLEKHRAHLKDKSINVITRYVKMKLHIDMSNSAMQYKIDHCFK